MSGSYALVATALVHGHAVNEARAAPGQALRLGPGGDLEVPGGPDGGAWARIGWEGPTRVVVHDANGGVHRLGPEDVVVLRGGMTSIELRLARQFVPRRTLRWPWHGSLAWFVVLIATSLLTSQVEVAWRLRCLINPAFCPTQTAGDGGGGFNSEFLARLLRRDLAGQDKEGIVFDDPPRDPTAPQFDDWMPAGDAGPITHKGGSEQTAPVPVRLPEHKPVKPAAPKKQQLPPEVAAEGKPVVAEQAPEVPDAVSDADEGLTEQPREDESAPASDGRREEQQGWGLRDWMDATLSTDKVQVELMRRAAQRRVELDPDSPLALGALAYYQYLQEDLDAAEKTFDRYIEQVPEDPGGYSNKALVYKRRKEWAREEGLYRLALALDPLDTVVLNNLAVNLGHQGRFDEALQIMKRLEELEPGDPYSDLHRAKIHAAKGDKEVALTYLRRALSGIRKLDVMHRIEFRQDIRVDPSLEGMRSDPRVIALLMEYDAGRPPRPERP